MKAAMWQEQNTNKQMAYLEYAVSFARKNSALMITSLVDLVQDFYAENRIHDPKKWRPRC